ncbi:MAG: PilZ domain-containing protein [Oscillospiraceae bacterium]|nr:PilZ domain-containing protein [Oscillospiraceae bacterium]
MNGELGLGERLEIMVGEKRCVSDIQELPKEGILILSAPTHRGVPLALPEGEMLHVTFYRAGGMFSFMARLRRRFKEGTLSLVEVELCSPISKYQRREFVRLETVLPLSVRLLATPEQFAGRTVEEMLRRICDRRYEGIPRPLRPGERIYACHTIDLSGGGARFAAEENFEKGALLECTFSLKGRESLTADGHVVRVEEQESEGPRYRVSVRFVNMEERLRRNIIKYIFGEQSKERQKTRM